MIETWKDAVGYEGIYEISSLGSLRTKEGKITRTNRHGERHWKQRILKLKSDRNGYKRVSLWIDGKNQDWLVHRLVAIAFLPNPNKYPMVNHKDGNTSNNNYENLEWCDSNHNVNHAFDNGLMPATKTKLTNEDGDEFIFRSMSKAGQFLGFSDKYISDLKSRKKLPFKINGYLIELVD